MIRELTVAGDRNGLTLAGKPRIMNPVEFANDEKGNYEPPSTIQSDGILIVIALCRPWPTSATFLFLRGITLIGRNQTHAY